MRVRALERAVRRAARVRAEPVWLGKVGAGDISKRTAANYVKALQYFLAWVYKRDRIVSRRVPDLDELFRFSDISGTTTAVAATLGRRYIGIDRSADYCAFARQRVQEAKSRIAAARCPEAEFAMFKTPSITEAEVGP